MALKFTSGQFPTRVIGRREAAGLLLTETGYTPNQRLRRHSHEYANFIIVLRGTFTERSGTRTHWCKPSSVIFRPADGLHANHFHQAGGSCLTIEIGPHAWKRIGDHSIIPDEPAYFQNPLLTTISSRLYGEFRCDDAMSTLALEGLALEMIAAVSRFSVKKSIPPPTRRIERAREIIHAHFSEHLTLSLVAELVDTHPVYLAREFRRRYHCTVGEYIRHLRIESARREIASSDMPIAEIAVAAGFFDQSHFSRTFRQFTGMSPAEYRKTVCPR